MKKLILLSGLVLTLFTTSCSSKEEKPKRGLDYAKLKTELALNQDQSSKFDELAAKYTAMAEENKAANTSDGGQMDRTSFFTRMEEIYKNQKNDFAQILDENQMAKYIAFMDQNTRKRPRYNEELLVKLKTELELDEQQSKVLEAANNAFEKEFQNAHDIYHGNNELAAEYWKKFDDQRKAAIEKVLNDEQKLKFEDLIKEVKSPAEK